MLVWAAPGWLIAGALAGLLPLALHLISRHPAEPVPLPTFRFLSRDPRTRLRLRRPTDLPLLLLRLLFLLLVAASLAGPRWRPERVGMAELVLLDRGAGMRGPVWTAAVDSARNLLLGPEGEPRGGLVLFDTAATVLPALRLNSALFDSLAAAGPGGAATRYAAGLRALPAGAAELRDADSIRATLLTRPRTAAWSAGLRYVRRAAWPGRLRLPALPAGGSPSAAPAAAASGAPLAAVVGERGGGYVAAALAATGWRVVRDVKGTSAAAEGGVALDPPSRETAQALLAAARGGATVVVAGPSPSGMLADSLLWPRAGVPEPAPGAILLADGTAIAGASRRYRGAPAPGARLVAAWEDGRPAAAAHPFGRGCLVRLATDLEVGELPLAAEFPRLIDALLSACDGHGNGGDADAVRKRGEPSLDAGGVVRLRGSGPAAVASASFAGAGSAAEGVSLARWLLLGALAVALIESWIAYRLR